MNSKSSKGTRTTLRRNAVAQACVTFAMIMAAGSQVANAGPGFVDITLQNGLTGRQQTYFAYSPSGVRDTDVAEGAAFGVPTVNVGGVERQTTGRALRKFVDPLAMPRMPGTTTPAPTLTGDATAEKYIPVAAVSKWVNPRGEVTGHDYYEIAVVEYSEKFHSDLTKATTLRGYVQIDHQASNGRPQLDPSKTPYALTYPDGTPILIAATDANGKLTGGTVQALAVDKPHFLGPVIAATKDTPTRVKFLNLLPAGRGEIITPAEKNLTGETVKQAVVARNGDIFLPVDKSIPGSGVGPDGVTEYTQNRADIHLHGGDTPWISDGTPHQWITPIGEADVANAKSLAAYFNNNANLDPSYLKDYLRGASAQNVPDMNDPGPGAVTYYFPNGQSARMLWYHDHTLGMTRLNVYAGMASAYLLTDSFEQGMINNGILPPAERTLPLVLQDRTFVPDDIALQDARWNTTAWGQPGDSWFPHVYETVQDPKQQQNWNAVGRWHYGPWFWPVFPALYSLPTGEYGDVTTTPEAWMDTPIINGVAYPTLTVDPTTYRFRLLNASNDRMLTFNLFEATDQIPDGMGGFTTNPLGATEVEMVPAAPAVAGMQCAPGVTRPTQITTGEFCQPETWPTDARPGGMPSPAAVGPTLHQIASEGGWLPAVASKDPAPIRYIMDKGRITVLNVDTSAPSSLLLAPAERADVVVDFSQYAGKTLIVYNDSGAPVPAGDPRNDLYTGVGDQSGSGGAEDTKPGYGPNTRTMMQIKVNALVGGTTAPVEYDPAPLKAAISEAYLASQEKPVVAQRDYAGFNPTWASLSDPQQYASIYTGSLKEPTFKFTPGEPNTNLNSVVVTDQGAGYITAPKVTIDAPALGGTAATAVASMKIDTMIVTNGGSGYTMAPTISVVSTVGGNGVAVNATLAINKVNVIAGGSKYDPATTVVKFTAPPTGGAAPVLAVPPVTVDANGAITAINIATPGTGYVAAPFVTITGGGGSGARASTTGSVGALTVIPTDPMVPSTAGGGGYTDLTTTGVVPPLQITFTGGGGTGARAIATGKVFDITLTNSGSGYATNEKPGITLEAPVTPAGLPSRIATASGDLTVNGTASGSILVKTPTIQELFDPTYGRLNATLGIELPFTSAMTQTTIPLAYVDAPTENFANGETQIWKITHNGVDTHPVHFHLLNVQLINRVGWDGFITPPDANELGWKETLRLSPLEDAIVAVRAKTPKLDGFGVPLSNRPMDPTQPLGSPFGFTQIDPLTGNPKTVVNEMQNYQWEYVWHCHILGHEENDFMRPVVFNANEAVPVAPALTQVALQNGAAKLDFVDNSKTEYKFNILRQELNADNTVKVAFDPTKPIGTELANANSYIDSTIAADTTYEYKVVAVGAAGDATSNSFALNTSTAAPAVPTGFTATAVSDSQVALSWVDAATNEAGYLLEQSIDNGASFMAIGNPKPVPGSGNLITLPANTQATQANGYVSGQHIDYRLSAVNGFGASAPVTATVDTLGAPAVTGLAVTGFTDSTVALSWNAADAGLPNNMKPTGYRITRTSGASTVTTNVSAATVNFTDSGLTQNTAYTYTVAAVNGSFVGQASAPVSQTTDFAPANTVTGLTGKATTGQVTLTWTGGTPATGYTIVRTNGSTSVTLPPVNAPATSYVDATVADSTVYTYAVTTINGTKTSAAAFANVSTGQAVTQPATLTASVSSTAINLAYGNSNETRFVIERSTNGGAFEQVGLRIADTLNFSNTIGTLPTQVQAGNTYDYRVIAQRGTGTWSSASFVVTGSSAPSPTATVPFLVPGAPTGLNATSVTRAGGFDTVVLKWTAPTMLAGQPAITANRVEWSLTPDFAVVAGSKAFGNVVTGSVSVPRGNKAAPSPKAYYFRVRSSNVPGAGAYSLPVGPVSTL